MDPIEHFLSGWAECGVRGKIPREAVHVNGTYDNRVFAWLQRVRHHNHHTPKKWCQCINHSLSQANYPR